MNVKTTETRINAFTNDVLGKLDATGVAEAIKKKEVSVREVTEAAIARAEKANPALNAIVIKMYDQVRDLSDTAGGGALLGVPTFIKDNEPMAGYPTQMGTGVFTSKPAKRHSLFVEQMLSTGLRALGKTTMPEFGFICSTENEKWGITRNPWNTDYTSGGSSSGSASLVASGVVPIASANDGAGSIRIPAAICGLVGLKPSRHRLRPMDGTELMPLNIVHEGVLTRSVRDTALFYSEAEKHYSNSKLPKLEHVRRASNERLKIAFFHNQAIGRTGHQDEATYQTQVEVANLLTSLGHEVEQIELPIDVDTMVDYFLHYYGFLAYMVSHWGRFTLGASVDRSQLEPFTSGLSQNFRSRATQLPKTVSQMKKIGREVEQLFSRYQVIMTPALSHQTPKIGYFSPELSYEEVTKRAVNFASYCGLQNVTGAPAISLPMGFDPNGMPLGLQFTAPYGLDKRLLEIAYELEQARPWKMIWETV